MNATHPNQSKSILVVDDDGDIRQALEMLLRFEGFEVLTARDGEEAWARLEQSKDRLPAAILTDLKMPNLDGLGLLEKVQGLDTPPPVVLISGHGDVATAVTAMQTGAANFLEKPLDDNRVLVTLRTVLRTQKLEDENSSLRERLEDPHRLIGSSPALQSLREQVQQVAASPASVLITGENGSGKEVLARSIHAQSPRAAGPFITVNCAAIPGELIESELFGHEKGSFTGATGKRIGHFEAANGGTLFLDEIGDMPLAAQAKVLRALETLEVTRVGGSETHPVDIRVLAATNADLNQSVEDKTFRMDLFYRLNVVPLRAPALREHPGDIGEIADHLLALQAERSGRRAPTIEEDALAFLA
ncbi:MAG: sigma-54 dependent transcriptional regulator, partial [Planctomycetota bacterium]|nr:sigma-54 dependent transcriptional regulator [Planctomycetota bacterium]